MSDILTAFNTLSQIGWSTSLLKNEVQLPITITARYPWITREVSDVLKKIKSAVRNDNKVWLLSSLDYRGESKASEAFAWDFCETLCLDSARIIPDEAWAVEIQAFWDLHLPVALSILNGYSYFALKQGGEVVFGREPDLEDITHYASSYVEFINKLGREPLNSP